MIGMVKQWNVERGYGWVAASDGRNYFLHIRQWLEPTGVPEVGRQVGFTLGVGFKGKPTQAVGAHYLNSEIDTLLHPVEAFAGDALKAGV